MGLTGGIATGKSTVTSMLRQLGARIIDADELAREIVGPGQEAWREIVEAFGSEMVRADQTIDREKLRKIIFADPQARKRLESITHPRIRALAQERIGQLAAEGAELVIYAAPLLFENQVHLWLRPVILVACAATLQKQRLLKRDGLSEEEARRHLQAQMSLEEKRKLADFIIENDGSLEELEKKVREVWEKITKQAIGNRQQ
ncbi:MAG: dephospho-CoA kinase [Deltaproteobacteria bacterium]|nr:dephospho-CoA kinase [Deltaproteobacteria bacterium]MBI2991855.1 dephospho-CoA kinase [Deltaproteobacteria bacterium]